MRHHKGFSDIEADIRRYYDDGTMTAELTALKIAGRALAIAQIAARPENRLAIEQTKQMVFDILLVHQTGG